MRNTNNIPWLTLSLTVFAIVPSAVPALAQWLVFDHTGILDGQWWRIATGNLVHFSIDHLVLDITAIGLAGWLIERRNRYALALLVGISALAVGLAILWFAPDVMHYGGLSGVACALVGYLALLGIERGGVGRWGFVMALLLLTAKISYETATGQTLFVASRAGTFVLPLAHLTGLVCGAGFWAATTLLNRWRNQPTERGDLPVTTTGANHGGNGSDAIPATISLLKKGAA